MKIALAIILNAALLAVLVPWLLRQWRWAATPWWRRAFVAGLGLRLGVGVARSWSPTLDAEFMSYLGQQVSAQLWEHPTSTFTILTKAITIIPIRTASGGYEAVYQGLSNTWFLVKLLGVLNFASLGVPGINGLYLSMFAFVGCWQLVRRLAEVFPETPTGAGVVAFLLWPSVWFWTTGISKEAVLLGSGAGLTARVIGALYGHVAADAPAMWPRIAWGLGTAGLALLHFKMRYFFALPLLGVLVGLALGRGLEQLGLVRQRWRQAAVLVAVLGIGLWVAPQISVAFSVNKFTNQVIRVYSFEVAHSAGKPHFEYPDLRPTLESIAAHAPLAAVNAVCRPWLGESWQLKYVASALENAALLGLLGLAIAATLGGRPGRMPFLVGLALGIFCLILAILIGLTTPNLGSLSRYRSELLPFMVLLLLQNDYAAAVLRRLGPGSQPDR